MDYNKFSETVVGGRLEDIFQSPLQVHPDVKFGELVEPMAENIDLLYRKNFNLQQTRDLLLPRLISGELDVETMDIKVDN